MSTPTVSVPGVSTTPSPALSTPARAGITFLLALAVPVLAVLCAVTPAGPLLAGLAVLAALRSATKLSRSGLAILVTGALGGLLLLAGIVGLLVWWISRTPFG